MKKIIKETRRLTFHFGPYNSRYQAHTSVSNRGPLLTQLSHLTQLAQLVSTFQLKWKITTDMALYIQNKPRST